VYFVKDVLQMVVLEKNKINIFKEKFSSSILFTIQNNRFKKSFFI
jgi:hypothetical protein